VTTHHTVRRPGATETRDQGWPDRRGGAFLPSGPRTRAIGPTVQTIESPIKMDQSEFRDYHAPALNRAAARHSVILNVLARMTAGQPVATSCWTLGEPGQCAIRNGPYSIVLGDVDEGQCRRLAEMTAATAYPGVMGPDATAQWFVDHARDAEHQFLEPEPQRIYAIRKPPRFPGASGHARLAAVADTPVLLAWALAFHREAVPNDPLPSSEQLERIAREDTFLLWIENDQPVSMAGIVRRLEASASISRVYTPPERRGRGYAGSVTAAAVEQIQAEGRAIACLYADLRNPVSNRCYQRIGFTPVCDSLHFHRLPAP
jgi:ribosomal protein S18 acetylase RimI-like enzyme